MGELYVHINVSVDGFITDAGGGLQWWAMDSEFNRYIDAMLDSIDAMVLGRTAYDALAQFWPHAGEEMSAMQRSRMHELPKYLLSHSRSPHDWHNTHLLGPDLAAALTELKDRSGRDVAVFAGAGAARSAIATGLVDELRLVVHPALVGSGTPLFPAGSPARELQLVAADQFRSGVVVLRYRFGDAIAGQVSAARIEQGQS